MKTTHILVLLAVISAALVGCSSVTPNPQVKIIYVSPVGLTTDTSKTNALQITFRNYSKVDAIITTEQDIFRGYRDSIGTQGDHHTVVAATIVNPDQYYSLFVPGNSDSTVLTINVTGTYLAYMTGALGATSSSYTWSLRFSGTDAYGYNKTFSDTCNVTF